MKDLTQGSIHKTFLQFSIPLILSSLLLQAYSTADLVIAGKLIGEDALAAIGSTSTFITFLYSGFWGLNNGFSIYIARLFGAKEYAKLKQGICSILLADICLALALSVLTIVGWYPIFRILQVDSEILDAARIYFLITQAGFFVNVLNSASTYMFNAIGTTTVPSILSALTAVLNIGGNLLTVVVFKWGIAGLAISSVFSWIVCAVFLWIKLRSTFRKLKTEVELPLFSFSVLKEGLPFGTPVMMQQYVMYFAGLILAPTVNGIGKSATAAYTVVNKIYNLNANVYNNATRVLGSYSGQCIGSKQPEKIRRGIRVSYLQANLFLLPILVVCICFPEAVASIFFRDGDPQSMAYSVEFTRLFLPFILANVINNIFHNLFRGVKKMNYLFTSTAIETIVRIGVTLLLIPNMGMTGFYIGWASSWVVEALYCVVIYRTDRWIPEELKEQIGTQKHPGAA